MPKEPLYRIFDRITEYCLYGLIFFTPISIAGVEILFGLLFIFFLLKKIIRPEFRFFKSKANLFLLIFFIFNCFSLLNSGQYFVKSLHALFFKWLEYLLIFFIVSDTLRDSKIRCRVCAYILIGSGVLLGVDATTQKFIGLEFMRHRPMAMVINTIDGKLTGVKASFQHYNAFATYLVCVLSLMVSLLISKKIFWRKVFLYLSIFLLTFSLVLTFSRAGWLAFIFSMVLMLILSRKAGKLIPVLIFFAVVIFTVPDLRERFVFAFQKRGDADRLAVWHSTLAMIRDNPFLGKGVGTFMSYFHKYVPPYIYTRYAHNCYLQIWAETGIFSLLAFMSFLISLLIKGIIGFKKTNDSLVLGLVCAISAFLFHSFFDTQFYSLQLSVLFWVMAGILNSMIRAETIG
jgi:O-antigen ligase